jgi:hypothetical protein
MAKSTGSGRSGKSARRREELRRNIRRPAVDYLVLLRRPELVRAAGILALMALLSALIVDWSRNQVLVSHGQIMTDTRLKRVDYQVTDDAATEKQRDEARKNVGRIYVLNTSYLDRLEAQLRGLPKAVAAKTPGEVSEEIRTQYRLDEKAIAALEVHAAEAAERQWEQAVVRLARELLRKHPLLESQEFQRYLVSVNPQHRLPEGRLESLERRNAIELRHADEPNEDLQELARRAGFPAVLLPHLSSRLALQPTLEFDAAESKRAAEQAAAAVQPVLVQHRAGDVLYRLGDRLSAQQYSDVSTEAERYAAAVSPTARWLPALGILGICGLVALGLGLFVAASHPRLLRNQWRVFALAALMVFSLAVAAAISRHAPSVLYAAAIGATLFTAVVVLLAYDQRLAVVVGAMQSVLVTMALQEGVGWFLLLLVGCTAMVAQLREVRHRNSLIRAATVTALVLGAGALALGAMETPLVEGMWRQVTLQAGWAGVASFGVGFLVLGLLPSFERLFGVTTGMTLAELRDPRQPLLRQLQQRAPGTYNHSLQVATLSEAAAEAVGADELLVYVGALYHDVGKLNKPEYFVENQAGGDNKHDKLSPAMSLLVIIGHVKDGVELAREYNLPRQLIHFIEAHHGTTLVEYFYHAARTRAESDERSAVKETEFRYPGPKPRTREVAILMIADAVESAARTMAEPIPSRIEALVRQISRKRMADGQFDHCPLTFRELSLIEDAMIGRLCAIHHGRISYPSSARDEAEAASEAKPLSA